MAINCAYVCTQDLVLSLDYMPLVKSMHGSVQVSRPRHCINNNLVLTISLGQTQFLSSNLVRSTSWLGHSGVGLGVSIHWTGLLD